MLERLRIGDLFARAVALVHGDLAGFAITLLLLAGFATTADVLLADEALVANLPLAIASLFAQYAATQRALRIEGLSSGWSRPRVGALFGLCFLTSLAIGIGLVLLVLPGLYLLARWSISVPILIGEDADVTQAMRESWERTGSNALPIALTFVLIFAPAFAVVVALGAMYAGIAADAGTRDPVMMMFDATTNFIAYAALMVGWYLAVAIHARLSPDNERLAEVFA